MEWMLNILKEDKPIMDRAGLNMRHADYMTWPRAFAISECCGRQKQLRIGTILPERVEEHFERFDIAKIKYSPGTYDPCLSIRVTTPDKQLNN